MVDMSKGYTQALVEECKRQGILRNQCAYVLATVRWETAHTMKPVREAFWIYPNNPEKADEWLRTHKPTSRYYPWIGRGFVQLTWEKNYKFAEDQLGVTLTKRPELALDPGIACEIAVTGMREGWFTGKKLSDYITLKKSDFRGARRIINGTDKAQSIADIAKLYDADLKREGYEEAV